MTAFPEAFFQFLHNLSDFVHAVAEVIAMRKLELAAAIGLILAIVCGNFAEFTQRLGTLHSDVLRLHILADSDDPDDQALKLLVRDELLRHSEALFGDCTTPEEIKARAAQEQEQIRRIAQQVLEENGCTDKVTVQLVQMDFEERQYDDFTMPAGTYDALRILIGRGEGHNWWCVMYPPLCLPAASADDCFDADTAEMLEHPEEFEVKFKCVELWNAAAERLRGEQED